VSWWQVLGGEVVGDRRVLELEFPIYPNLFKSTS